MQKIGLFLLAAGVAVIVGYIIWGFVEYLVGFLPWPLRIAIAAIPAGGILILASLIWERMKKSKEEKEKFKGVNQ
jgi:type VI protein secretion system component VasK